MISYLLPCIPFSKGIYSIKKESIKFFPFRVDPFLLFSENGSSLKGKTLILSFRVDPFSDRSKTNSGTAVSLEGVSISPNCVFLERNKLMLQLSYIASFYEHDA